MDNYRCREKAICALSSLHSFTKDGHEKGIKIQESGPKTTIMLISVLNIYKTSSTSSTICTLILPLLKSPHVCKASNAFSNGKVWLTSGFKSRIPPPKH